MTRTTRLALAVAVLLLATPVLATHWVALASQADCAGWRVDGEVKIGSSHHYVDVGYTVTLASGSEVLEEQSGTVRVYLSATTSPFTVTGTWTAPPTGAATVAGTFFLPHTSQGDSIQTFALVLSCGESPVAHRPRWWIRHRDRWPVDRLAVAGREYGQDELVALMRRCGRSRLKVRLLRHLVAVRLNDLAGVPDAPAAAMEAADAFLAEHGLHGGLPRHLRHEARQLLRELRRFNRGGGAGKSLAGDPLPLSDLEHEQFHWGDLKAAYR